MIEEEELTTIMKWSEDPNLLENALIDESPSVQSQMNVELFRVFEDLELYKGLIPTSSATGIGIEDIYNNIQHIFAGGEDLEKD